jgi:putative addiction module killer protein
MRVDRLIHGSAGASCYLAEGDSELKIDVGPGYRVYYARHGNRLLLNDIAKALELNSQFLEDCQ